MKEEKNMTYFDVMMRMATVFDKWEVPYLVNKAFGGYCFQFPWCVNATIHCDVLVNSSDVTDVEVSLIPGIISATMSDFEAACRIVDLWRNK